MAVTSPWLPQGAVGAVPGEQGEGALHLRALLAGVVLTALSVALAAVV